MKVLAIALCSFVASFLMVPLVGTEFMPEIDHSFISLRLNTPVGSSLEYTNDKVAAGRGGAEAISRDRDGDDQRRAPTTAATTRASI